MRLALGLERDLGALAGQDISEEAAWFTVMATGPLRTVFERAFSLPETTGALDVDRQLEIFRSKARAHFGDTGIAQFADPEKLDELRRTFLAQSELRGAGGLAQSARGSAALAILQQSSSAGSVLPGF